MTALALAILVAWLGPGTEVRMDPIDRLLDAMIQAESGGDRNAVGDGGKSRGPLQIQEPYWGEACLQLYKERADGFLRDWETWAMFEAESRRVVRAYWRRYCRLNYRLAQNAVWGSPRCWEYCETLARTHNGGPNGARKKSTLPYWRKVKAEMERQEEKP